MSRAPRLPDGFGSRCASSASPERIFRGIRESSSHHRTTLGTRINEIGAGHAGPWTVAFGASPELDLDNFSTGRVNP